MEKRKKYISLFLFLALIGIVLLYFIFSLLRNGEDKSTYFTLLEGNATLNLEPIDPQDKKQLKAQDTIRTIGNSSLGVITWGDGSVTRMSGNSEVRIDKSLISQDESTIQIAFEHLSGKTWSQVNSFIGSDSHFTQKFEGVEAGVRGTVFNVDLQKDIVYVSDHELEIEDADGNMYIVAEETALSLDTFGLIEFGRYITEFQDKAWTDFNTLADESHSKVLTQALTEFDNAKGFLDIILRWFSVEKKLIYALDTAEDYTQVEKIISKLSSEKKQDLYSVVLTRYQSLNFLNSTDLLYDRKIFYKRALVSLTTNTEEQERLLQSSVYDIKDILDTENMGALKDTLSLFTENEEIVSRLDFSSIENTLSFIPDGLREELESSLTGVTDIFESFDIDSISEDAKNLLDNADEGIQNILDNTIGNFLN